MPGTSWPSVICPIRAEDSIMGVDVCHTSLIIKRRAVPTEFDLLKRSPRFFACRMETGLQEDSRWSPLPEDCWLCRVPSGKGRSARSCF